MVEYPHQGFELSPPTRFPIAPVLQKGSEALQLVLGEAELGGFRVYLNAEKCETGGWAVSFVLREGGPKLGADIVQRSQRLGVFR